MEYVYIRTTEQSTAIHFGMTTDYEKRYKKNADQVEETNKFLYVFQCNDGTGHKIEKDFKNKFKEYLGEREIYLWNANLKERYLHFIRTHKDVIKEIEIEDKNSAVKKKVVKVKTDSRNLKEMGWTMKDMQMSAQRKAKALQKDNSLTEFCEHDEYYTRYEDVENIVGKFAKEFKNKVVFCNCDDVLSESDDKCSAFALYFKKNFKKLKLKRLICTHFAGITNLFNVEGTIGYIYSYDGNVIEIKSKNGYNGSFYDEESIRILNEDADICCTNHPWSLTKKFYEILFNSGKKFLVISNSGLCLIPMFFDKIKSKELKVFDYCKKYYNKKKNEVQADGAWYTNFNDVPYNFDRLKLVKLKEIPKKYIKVDDKGVLVFSNCYIPTDYKKEFAVSKGPIINGVLEKGFEIVIAKKIFKTSKTKEYYPYINGKKQWSSLLLRKNK